MKTDECVLFSGAANGAESEFGSAAERRGIDEVNFTFEGHKDARSRGIRVLTHEELKHGDVSLAYVSNLMHRRYPDTQPAGSDDKARLSKHASFEKRAFRLHPARARASQVGTSVNIHQRPHPQHPPALAGEACAPFAPRTDVARCTDPP